MRRLFPLLAALLAFPAPAFSGPTNEEDRRYLEEFAKRPRNINKVKREHLVRVFPLIGLSAVKAEAIHDHTRRVGGVETLDDLLAVPAVDPRDLEVLRRYFYAERDPAPPIPASVTNEGDRRYLAEFAKQSRNINKVRREHLVRVFPLIGLPVRTAEEVYEFTRSREGVGSLEELLALPSVTTQALSVLRVYFHAARDGDTNILAADLDEVFETLAEDAEMSEDDPRRKELEELAVRRLDLNTASPEELARIPWLTPFNIYNIVERRRRQPFRRPEELMSVPGIDAATYRLVAPFVTVRPTTPSDVGDRVEKARRRPPVSGEVSFRSVSSLPPDREHFTKVLAPSAAGFRMVGRLVFLDRYRVGAILERDRGEEELWDLVKYTVSAERLGFVKKAVVGHFRLTAGQGLTLSDRGPSKGLSPTSVRLATTTALKEDLGAYENRWFHGPAVHWGVGRWEGFLFYSFLPQDGTVATNAGMRVITSFDPDGDGMHDTALAKARKDAFVRQAFGGRVAVTWRLPEPARHLKAGLTAYRTVFPYPVLPGDEAYRRFAFRGRSLTAVGLDWDLVWSAVSWFGEVSVPVRSEPVGYVASQHETNLTAALGLYTGVLVQTRGAKSALAFRTYQDRWVRIDAMPFSEYSSAGGETGLYAVHELRIGRRTRFAAYGDVFTSSWRRYEEELPPFGFELAGRVEQRFADRTLLSAQVKTERKLVKWKAAAESNVMTVADYDRRVRVEAELPVMRTAAFRFRTEFARTEVPELRRSYDSVLGFVDLTWRPVFGTTLRCRLVAFDTVYEARIWEFENDIPAYMASLSLLGRGGRFYVLASREVVPRRVALHLKTAVTRHFRRLEEAEIREEDGRLSASEAAERVAGMTRYDVRLQLVSRF